MCITLCISIAIVAQVCFRKTSGLTRQSGYRPCRAFVRMLLTWPLRTKSQPEERRNSRLPVHGRSTSICFEYLLARRQMLFARLLGRRRCERVFVFCFATYPCRILGTDQRHCEGQRGNCYIIGVKFQLHWEAAGSCEPASTPWGTGAGGYWWAKLAARPSQDFTKRFRLA